jgi:ATP-dependent DNA helicase DinG
LGTGGVVAKAIAGFAPRTAQQNMAMAIVDSIETTQTQGASKQLVVEAGTGTGKTFAYLVPALLSGKRVVVSTASKTLQDQLFHKDIPAVCQALKNDARVVLLKGRQNYLCHHHLQRATEQGMLPTAADVRWLKRIRSFAQSTRTGDKAECTGIPEDAAVWSWVTSQQHNCLGSECAHARDCFVLKARRAALEADVVVVNHHLFLADMALKEEGEAALLPEAEVIIFDEAHQLPDIATHMLGDAVSTHQVLDLVRMAVVEGLSQARDAADWHQIAQPIEEAARAVRLAFSAVEGDKAQTSKPSHAQVLALEPVHAACQALAHELTVWVGFMHTLAPRDTAWQKLYEHSADVLQRWQAWLDKVPATTTSVRWANISTHAVQLCVSPLDVSNAFAALYTQEPRTWVFTSATLSIRNSLNHFALRLGLENSQHMLLESPFDYTEQALMWVPENLPWPNHPSFHDKLCETLLPLLEASQGGVFFLSTSHRGVRAIGAQLNAWVQQHGLDWTVLVQGELPRGELLQQFRAAAKPVLVGAASFWEGVDIRGEALRMVIIDKLPFASPDDPIYQAKSQQLQARGEDAFAQLSLPDAVIALKQGVGRLIRDTSDWGVLVIGDRRLVEKPYGQTIWRSLPAFARTRSAQRALEFMQARRAAD